MTEPTDLDASLERKTVRATLATRALIVLVVITAVIVIALQLVSTLQTRHIAGGIAAQQDTNTSTVRSIRGIARQIRSCTTPGQPCSVRGQRQTAKAVGDIGAANKAAAAAAAACAAQIPEPTYQSVLTCMNRTLAVRPDRAGGP